jgi:hypothetical protein
MSIENTPKEKGLIKNLSRRNRQLQWTTDELSMTRAVAKNMIYRLGGEQELYNYLVAIDTRTKAYKLTEIGDYTNKKGITSKAHYTQNGNYYGSVRTHGDTPIYVLTETQVEEDNKHLWKVSDKQPHNLIAIDPRV